MCIAKCHACFQELHLVGVEETCNLVGYCSPFRELNDTRAVNRTHERFCVCDSLTLRHNKISQEQLNFFQNSLYLYKRKKFNI